jgi:nitrous oxidase accessory protein
MLRFDSTFLGARASRPLSSKMTIHALCAPCPQLTLVVFLAALLGLLASSPGGSAWGQAAGFDLNAALAAAQPGDTITVPAGVYPGPLVIDKAITLVGQDMPVIQGTGSGDVVQITAPNVTLRGFVVRNSGISLDQENAAIVVTADHVILENNHIEDALFGVYLANAPFGVVRGNVISGKDLPVSRMGDGLKVWYSADSLIENNTVRYSRDSVIWFSPRTVVRNNMLEHSRYGLHFMSSSDHLIENNVLRYNSVGVYLMYGGNYTLRQNLLFHNRGPSGYGIGMKEINDALIEGNRIVSNRVGVYSDASPLLPESTVEFRRNLFAYNEIGFVFLPNVKRNHFTDNAFLDNAEQINIAGNGELTENEWAVGERGNYWSDYNGFDADGDSIGDLPHQSRSLYESLTANYPELRLFQLGPAADALDLAAKAFPIFQPRPLMADPYPLMTPPQLPPVPGLPEGSFWLNLALALGMVIGALALMVWGARSFIRG